MRKKYKFKKKKVFSSLYIIVIFCIITIFFGVGYSIYSTELTIKGLARIENSETDIPVEIKPGTEGGTDYVSLTVADNVMEVISQEIIGDTINVNLRPTTSTGKPRAMDMVINFVNKTNNTYINGTASYEGTGDEGFIRQNPNVSVATTLQPGEQGSLNVNFPQVKFNMLNTSCVCKFTVTYTVDNVEVYFNIVLNISR